MWLNAVILLALFCRCQLIVTNNSMLSLYITIFSFVKDLYVHVCMYCLLIWTSPFRPLLKIMYRPYYQRIRYFFAFSTHAENRCLHVDNSWVVLRDIIKILKCGVRFKWKVPSLKPLPKYFFHRHHYTEDRLYYKTKYFLFKLSFKIDLIWKCSDVFD